VPYATVQYYGSSLLTQEPALLIGQQLTVPPRPAISERGDCANAFCYTVVAANHSRNMSAPPIATANRK
jgi:hypothetical protein